MLTCQSLTCLSPKRISLLRSKLEFGFAMPYLKGQCLLASPHLQDPNFAHAVVLMLRHDDNEAFGLILNKPTGFLLNPILEDGCDWKGDREIPLFSGGPVEGPILCLHTKESLGELDCGNGIFLSSQEAKILELADDVDGVHRFFLGYSGWGPQQLEAELEEGSWLTITINRDEIFSNEENLWFKLVRRVGKSILAELIDPSILSTNPNLN